MSKAKTFSINKLTKTGLKEYLKKNPNHKCGVSSETTCPIAGYIRSQVGNTKISVTSDEIEVGTQRFSRKTNPSLPEWIPAFVTDFDDNFFNFSEVKASSVLKAKLL